MWQKQDAAAILHTAPDAVLFSAGVTDSSSGAVIVFIMSSNIFGMFVIQTKGLTSMIRSDVNPGGSGYRQKGLIV